MYYSSLGPAAAACTPQMRRRVLLLPAVKENTALLNYAMSPSLLAVCTPQGPERLEDYESALERLLEEFPLLFGYWKKLARLQCHLKGDWTKCDEVSHQPAAAAAAAAAACCFSCFCRCCCCCCCCSCCCCSSSSSSSCRIHLKDTIPPAA